MSNSTDPRTAPIPTVRVRYRRKPAAAGIALLTLLAVSALATSAQGATFCVHKPLCPGTTHTTIQAALDAAAVNGVTDTVLIGANGGVQYNEAPSYVDSETVHIVGDGIGETVIGSPGAIVSSLIMLSPTSTVSDMTLRVPNLSNGNALRWDGTARRIEAVHSGSSATSTLGMIMLGNAKLEDSSVRVNGFQAVNPQNTTGAKIEDTTIVSGGIGIQTTGQSKVDLSRVSVRAPRTSMSIGGFGSSATIDNVVLEMTGSNAVDCALCVSSGAGVVASHATIVGANAGRGASVEASSQPSTLTVGNSVIDNFETSLLRFGGAGHAANLGMSYSSFTDSTYQTGDGALTLGAGTIQQAPQFVNRPAHDFHLLTSSPLIDAANPSDPFTLDRDKLPRIAGGRADMGAYEYQPIAPSAAASGPATGAVGQGLQFTAAGSADSNAGDTLSYSWNFGDGSNTTGPEAEHAFASPGARTVTLTVTDATGLSDSATVQVVVSAPPIAGGGVPSDPSNPVPPAGNTGTATKCVIPKLAGKSLAKAKESLAAAHCKLGKVRRPKRTKHGLVVKSSSARAGKVDLKLKVKPRR